MLSENVAAADPTENTWIADSASSASVAGSWQNGTLLAGQLAWFTSVHNGGCTWDVTFQVQGLYVKGYTGTFGQSSNINLGTLGYWQTSGTVNPSASKYINNAGPFKHTGGTFNALNGRVNMTGADSTLATTSSFSTLTIVGKTTLTTNTIAYNLNVQGEFVIGNGVTFENRLHNVGSYANVGSISGSGTLKMSLHDANKTLALGHISCPLTIATRSVAPASKTLTMAADATIASLTIQSDHATNTITLDLAGHDLSSNGITVGTRGVLLGGEGTITNSGNLDTSAGTFNPESCTYISTGVAKTVKMATGQTLYRWVVANETSVSLLSNVNVTDRYDPWGSVSVGAYTLTYDHLGLYIVSEALDELTIGLNYNYQIEVAFASLSILNYSYSFNVTELAGNDAGLIMGRPGGVGPIAVSITISDSYGQVAYQNYTLNVNNPEGYITDSEVLTVILAIAFLAILTLIGFMYSIMLPVAGMAWLGLAVFVFYPYGDVFMYLSGAVGMFFMVMGVWENL